MIDSFVEYSDVSVAAPLRQGDVLEAVDPAASMWQRNLIVITADCDFAYEKHRGRVTCVPLLTADEYLAEMQIPKIRERLIKKRINALRSILTAAGAPRISDQRLREWASEEDPSTIVTQLELEDAKAQEARKTLASIRMIDAPAPTLNESVDALVDAQLLGPSPPKRDNALKTVVVPLQESYARPPGDALFLTAVAPTHEAGYFAYLRHIEQVWEPEISTSLARREVKYRRISRLKDRFTHALVQRFAMVFLAIGLPREYEDLRDLHSEILGDALK